MNAIFRTASSRTISGQTVYVVMLIIACVALALAAFFPTFEFFELLRGPAPTVTVVRTTPATPPPAAPTTEPQPVPEETTTTIPAPDGDLTGGAQAPVNNGIHFVKAPSNFVPPMGQQ